jgi:hypothetical protein
VWTTKHLEAPLRLSACAIPSSLQEQGYSPACSSVFTQATTCWIRVQLSLRQAWTRCSLSTRSLRVGLTWRMGPRLWVSTGVSMKSSTDSNQLSSMRKVVLAMWMALPSPSMVSITCNWPSFSQLIFSLGQLSHSATTIRVSLTGYKTSGETISTQRRTLIMSSRQWLYNKEPRECSQFNSCSMTSSLASTYPLELAPSISHSNLTQLTQHYFKIFHSVTPYSSIPSHSPSQPTRIEALCLT